MSLNLKHLTTYAKLILKHSWGDTLVDLEIRGRAIIWLR